jgi:Tol biopolymer transport system component
VVKKPAPAAPLPENKTGALQFIVEEGESSQPSYNTKGDKLLFVSRKRIGHKQDQVYEKDLSTGVEHRITFQNGSTFQPRYSPNGGTILYSSSTDELKENPPLLHPGSVPSKLPYPYQEPMEIYVHSLHGLDIDRISLHPGFDGEAHFADDGDTISFTRVNGLRTEIVTFQRKSHAAKSIKNLGINPTQYTPSHNGKIHAWVDWDEAFAVARLMLKKSKGEAAEIGSDMIVTKTDPSFSSDGKWLFWAQKDPEKPVYDLWTADTETLCPRRLTTSMEGERRSPVLSPDGKWLTFTLALKGRSRIARQGFTAPTGPCPPPS